jgi:hypothetical protein
VLATEGVNSKEPARKFVTRSTIEQQENGDHNGLRKRVIGEPNSESSLLNLGATKSKGGSKKSNPPVTPRINYIPAHSVYSGVPIGKKVLIADGKRKGLSGLSLNIGTEDSSSADGVDDGVHTSRVVEVGNDDVVNTSRVEVVNRLHPDDGADTVRRAGIAVLSSQPFAGTRDESSWKSMLSFGGQLTGGESLRKSMFSFGGPEAESLRKAVPNSILSTDNDGIRKASPISMGTKDESIRKASPIDISTKDDSTRKASPISMSTKDESIRKASPISMSTKDESTRKASPIHMLTNDESIRKASPINMITNDESIRKAIPIGVITKEPNN